MTQHHIRHQPLGQFHRFLPSAYIGHNVETARAQHRAQSFACQRVIVDDQDALEMFGVHGCVLT